MIKIKSRKFILVLLILVISTLLVSFKLIEAVHWVSALGIIIPAYFAGNVYQKRGEHENTE